MASRIFGLAKPQGERSGQGSREAVLVQMVDQLLELFAGEAERSETAEGSRLRGQLEPLRAGVTRTVDPDELARLSTSCLDTCRRHVQAARHAAAEREAGYQGLIEVLQETLATVARESGAFHADLTRVSERVNALVRVEEIQVLKQRLTEEAGEIRRVVVEKQMKEKTLQEQLTKRIRSLETSLAETQVAASIDPLTQVANRGQFDSLLAHWLKTRQSPEKAFVLVLVDLDHFKEINDTAGHQAGDQALVTAAKTLTGAVRPCDLVARYGGDEFALLMANMSLDQAEKRMPQIVEMVAGLKLGGGDGESAGPHLTNSSGKAQTAPDDTPEALLKRADEALYTAKRQGKNRAVAKRSGFWQGRFN
jgi:diguanylate cyclase